MTTPTPTAKVTAQSRLRELLPTNKQQRVAIDGACDAIDSLERELAAALERAERAEKLAGEARPLIEAAHAECEANRKIAERAEARAEAAEKDAERMRSALMQIKALAEYATTGPNTAPRCKSDALTSTQATSLRGSISEICDAAIAEGKR